MKTVLIFFWSSVAIVTYTYIGYGILISILVKIKQRTAAFKESITYCPDITIVIAAYNERSVIEEKILNTLSLKYPEDRREIFIVTDGSDDGSPDVVKKYPQVRLFHDNKRLGKAHAVNRVMKEVKSPIVIFSDANTFINAEGLETMVKHFAYPSVGGVAGEKRIVKKKSDSASGSGEGLYWKYESYLKKKDSELHSVQGAAGEFFSLRTALYEPPPKNIIIEDFYLSMKVIEKGFRFVYEPNAYAVETASASIAEEWKRKVRISAGGLQIVLKLWYFLNPFRFGYTTFQYFSHRVLRWTFAPLSLVVALICNAVLAIVYQLPIYNFILIAQLCWYALAIVGYLLRDKHIAIKGFFVPFYFVMMNIAVFAGLARFVFGTQSAIWEKSRRA